jgi:hypothetical protein
VKITVIATGFGAQTVARPTAPAATTPVDMTQYADYARLRSDTVPVQAPAASMSISMSMPPTRMTIARRSLLDLPMAASGGASTPPSSSSAPATSPVGSAEAVGKRDSDVMGTAPEGAATQTDTDFDLSSTFDVPAFLRRQEG